MDGAFQIEPGDTSQFPFQIIHGADTTFVIIVVAIVFLIVLAIIEEGHHRRRKGPWR